MSGPDFLDTNILVYAYAPADARKQKIAQGIVGKALSGGGIASLQVIGEFAATLLHKVARPMRPERAARPERDERDVRGFGSDTPAFLLRGAPRGD